MTSHVKSPEELDKDIEKLKRHIQAAKIARNAIRPVNLLSNEVLYAIFYYYQIHQIDGDNGRGRWVPAQVCSRWRQIVLEKSQFWRQITVSDSTSLDCVENVLLRSGNTPLVVCIALKSGSLQSLAACMESPALNRVLKELPRISTLVIKSNISVSNYILTALYGPAPLLSNLSVLAMDGAVRHFADYGVINLKQCGSMPFKSSLRTLHLALAGIPLHGDLRKALQGMPNLEHLVLWVSSIHITTELFVDEPIALPRLRSLRLLASASVSTRFLHSLSIPSECRLSIRWIYTYSGFEDGAALGRAIARKLWGADTNAGDAPLVKLDSDTRGKRASRKLSLSMWRDVSLQELADSGYNLSATFVLVIKSSASESVGYRPESLFHALPILPKVRRLVLGDSYSICGSALRLPSLGNVEEIAIRHDDASSSHLLIRLLQRRIHQQAPSLMFPKLRTIHLAWITFKDNWVHKPCPDNKSLPRYAASTKGRAKISLSCLKSALEKRQKDGMPAVSLILVSPIGLNRSALCTLAGLVEGITIDGTTVDLSVKTTALPAETAISTEPAKADSDGNESSTSEAPSPELMMELRKGAAEGYTIGEEGGGDDEQGSEGDEDGSESGDGWTDSSDSEDETEGE